MMRGEGDRNHNLANATPVSFAGSWERLLAQDWSSSLGDPLHSILVRFSPIRRTSQPGRTPSSFLLTLLSAPRDAAQSTPTPLPTGVADARLILVQGRGRPVAASNAVAWLTGETDGRSQVRGEARPSPYATRPSSRMWRSPRSGPRSTSRTSIAFTTPSSVARQSPVEIWISTATERRGPRPSPARASIRSIAASAPSAPWLSELHERALGIVDRMEHEGFGSCTNYPECEAVCPKRMKVKWIARMNRDYLKASFATATASGR